MRIANELRAIFTLYQRKHGERASEPIVCTCTLHAAHIPMNRERKCKTQRRHKSNDQRVLSALGGCVMKNQTENNIMKKWWTRKWMFNKHKHVVIIVAFAFCVVPLVFFCSASVHRLWHHYYCSVVCSLLLLFSVTLWTSVKCAKRSAYYG